MTEAVQIALIVGIPPTIVAAGAVIVNLKTAWAQAERDGITAAKVEKVAIKAEEVKRALHESDLSTAADLKDIKDVGEKVHTLVNHDRGVTLRALAAAL